MNQKYYKKYIKYKNKYLLKKNQIGGIVYADEKQLVPLCDPPYIRDSNYLIARYKWSSIINDNGPEKYMGWTINMEKGNIYEDFTSWTYSTRLEYFQSIELTLDKNKFVTGVFDSDIPYIFDPDITLDNMLGESNQIKIFTNIFSNLFHEKIIDTLIRNWFGEKMQEYVRRGGI